MSRDTLRTWQASYDTDCFKCGGAITAGDAYRLMTYYEDVQTCADCGEEVEQLDYCLKCETDRTFSKTVKRRAKVHATC